MAVDPNLGDYIPQQSNDPAGTGGTWQDFIKANRPFLAGMGAQLMVGSPGGVLSNIGAGVAKGNESQNMTEEMNYGRGVEERKFQAGQAEGEANRASHEKIATITGDSRAEVANIRGEYRAALAAATMKPQNSQEMTIYSKAAADYMKKEKDNQIISKKSDATISEEAKAWASKVLDDARSASGVRSQGAPLSTDASTSGVGTPDAPGAAPTGGSGQAASGDKGGSKPTWDQIKDNPTIKNLMKSSAGIQAIKKERPDLAPFLDREEALLNAPQTPGM